MGGTRTLVIGGAGFIGRHLVANLLADRHCVHVVIRPGTDARPLATLEGDLTVHRTELADRSALQAIVGTARPDQVYHMAAGDNRAPDPDFGDVRRSIHADVLGFIDVLAAVSASPNPPAVLVRAGSLAEYGPIGAPYNETQREAPASAHGAAALACTQIATMLRSRLPFALVNARLALVYGPGQSDRFLIPKLIRRCLSGLSTEIARPNDRRDVLHVDDAVAGLRALANAPFAPVVNLCTGIAPTMAEIAQSVVAETGAAPSLTALASTEPEGGTPVLVGSPDLAITGCGWRAQIPVQQGIAHTVAAERGARHVEQAA